MADVRLEGSKAFCDKEIKDFVAANPLCLQVVEGAKELRKHLPY